MNVLPLVFAMLLLLSCITYARMQSFVASKTIERHYDLYVRERLQQDNNTFQDKAYGSFHTLGNEKDSYTMPISAVRKIPIKSLLEGQSEDLNYRAFVRQLLKNLIHTLFSEHNFYQEALEKNPRIVDQVIDHLSDAREKDFKLETVSDLAKLSFPTDEERLFWYFLLSRPPVEGKDTGKEERTSAEDILEKTHSKAFQDLITLRPQDDRKQIRLYLTSKEILLALFQDPDLVQSLLQKRKALFSALNQKNERSTLTEEFRASFSSFVPPYAAPFLNWDVSKTAP